jgi:hypothetical protein
LVEDEQVTCILEWQLARGEPLNAESAVLAPDYIYKTYRGENQDKPFLPTAVALPAGFRIINDGDVLPFGVTLFANTLQDCELLALAERYEAELARKSHLSTTNTQIKLKIIAKVT